MVEILSLKLQLPLTRSLLARKLLHFIYTLVPSSSGGLREKVEQLPPIDQINCNRPLRSRILCCGFSHRPSCQDQYLCHYY